MVFAFTVVSHIVHVPNLLPSHHHHRHMLGGEIQGSGVPPASKICIFSIFLAYRRTGSPLWTVLIGRSGRHDHTRILCCGRLLRERSCGCRHVHIDGSKFGTRHFSCILCALRTVAHNLNSWPCTVRIRPRQFVCRPCRKHM